MAWQCNSPEMNMTGFKKICVSNAIDKTDDMWNESE
jgi:hypothetical protein